MNPLAAGLLAVAAMSQPIGSSVRELPYTPPSEPRGYGASKGTPQNVFAPGQSKALQKRRQKNRSAKKARQRNRR